MNEQSAEVRQAISHGVHSALRRGVLLRYPIINIDVTITRLICSANTPLPFFSNTAFVCTSNALKNAECVIIQPMMKLDVSYRNFYLSIVFSKHMKLE